MTQGFGQKTNDLGWIFSGKTYIVTFKYKDIKIIKIESSCNCVDTTIEDKFSRLLIKYKPVAVPQHLIDENVNHYKTKKTVIVNYVTEEEPNIPKVAILTIDASVMDKN